jgi:proteasome lid subunit RPN8/RPN11
MYQINYPFSKKLVAEIQSYLEEAHPNEAGGLVVNDTWIPLQNLSNRLHEEFDFDEAEYNYWKTKGNIQAIIHSHNDWPHASQEDMESQIYTGVPWGIVSIKNGRAVDVFFWGDQREPDELIGRPFHHGAHDCYALVRDYYKTLKFLRILLPREARLFAATLQ